MLWSRKIAQAMLTEVNESHVRTKGITNQLGGNVRHQDLPAVCDRHQTRTRSGPFRSSRHHEIRLAGMDPTRTRNGPVAGPLLLTEGHLHSLGGRQSFVARSRTRRGNHRPWP